MADNSDKSGGRVKKTNNEKYIISGSKFQEVKFSKNTQIFFKLCQGKLPKVFNQSINQRVYLASN